MMGGRGSSSGTKSHLPNYKNAVIDVHGKLKNYLLNPKKSNGKADFFKSIGYNMKNHKTLEKDIRNGLKRNPATEYKTNKYGHTAYSVNMELGINKKSDVVTGWQIDKGDNKPRFITAYPKKKGGK